MYTVLEILTIFGKHKLTYILQQKHFTSVTSLLCKLKQIPKIFSILLLMHTVVYILTIFGRPELTYTLL
jgi:hypothetical protein